MTDTVHNVTEVKKSRKFVLPSKKTAIKAVALTVFGAAVALVAVDKLTHRSQDSDANETETAGS